MIPSLAALVFVMSYVLIALETKFKISKAAVALSAGGLIWILLALWNPTGVESLIAHAGSELFNLVAFLLAAMSLVEIAGHYRLFDFIREKLCSYNLSLGAQFFAFMVVAFFLSAFLDNLTTTIVMIQIARKFFWNRNLLVVAAGIVISANAGGAFSPIGDVTTIMLWLADKFTAVEIIMYGFVPSFLSLAVSALMLSRKLAPEVSVRTGDEPCKVMMTASERTVLLLVALSFLMPIMVKTVHLPPVLGILFGLGITWMSIDLFKRVGKGESHLTASIEHLIQKADLGSIKFFIGILLAVSALGSLGVLDRVSDFLYGDGASFARVAVGNMSLGVASAVLDNIPLTAIAIEILEVVDVQLWVLLALCVGIGGSILSLGSAAGVVAMGMVKELTFEAYFKIASLPAFAGFATACFIWWLQHMLLVL